MELIEGGSEKVWYPLMQLMSYFNSYVCPEQKKYSFLNTSENLGHFVNKLKNLINFVLKFGFNYCFKCSPLYATKHTM